MREAMFTPSLMLYRLKKISPHANQYAAVQRDLIVIHFVNQLHNSLLQSAWESAQATIAIVIQYFSFVLTNRSI
jgi:hypothetical protein